MRLICVVLFIAVLYSGVHGDAGCFLRKLTDCSKQLGTDAALHATSVKLCKYRKQMFSCVHESAKECSVDQRYDFSEVEAMYENICTDGSTLNKKMQKYQNCLMNTFSTSLSCVQDIIDYVSKFKVVTPEVMAEVEKMTCRDRTTITNCYFGFIEKNCGKDARDFYETTSKASDKVNDDICRDLLNE